jgi:hypothetical protein
MCVTLYQARGVSSHVYMCVGIKPEKWVVMYICVWTTHTITWLITPLAGYKVDTHKHIYTWLLTPLARYPHTHIYMTSHRSEKSCVYGCGYRARLMSSHVYMCLWVSTLYQARGVISHVIVCVVIDPVPSQRHTHIYMTTHSSGSIPTHTYIHDYSLLWLDTHTHIYTWLFTPLARYPHTHIYTWLLTPLAWYPHTYIHDYSL